MQSTNLNNQNCLEINNGIDPMKESSSVQVAEYISLDCELFW